MYFLQGFCMLLRLVLFFCIFFIGVSFSQNNKDTATGKSAGNTQVVQTDTTEGRNPANFAIQKTAVQAEADQTAELKAVNSQSHSEESEPQAQGIILKFSEWPVQDEKSITNKLKKAGLEEAMKIERFKVWVYKWKVTRSAIKNENLCSDFSAISSVQSCELDLLLEPAQTQQASDDSETFNLQTCNIVSSNFNLNKYPNLKYRGGALSDYWAQEMVGADLLKKKIENLDSAKRPTVELFDSNKQNKHDELVKNLISGDGRSSVLPAMADNIGVSQSNTVSDLLKHSDDFLNKVDKVCGDSSQANQQDSGSSVSQRQTASSAGQAQAGSSEQEQAGSVGQAQAGSSEQEQAGSVGQAEAGSDEQEQAGSVGQAQAGSDEQEQAGSVGQAQAGSSEQEQAGSVGQAQAGSSEQEQAGSVGQAQAGSVGQRQTASSEGQTGLEGQGQVYSGNIAWQNLPASEIWAKMKNLSITNWQSMTYEEIKAKATEARAKWSKTPREWDINKQRAVNNAWAQQLRIKGTADEAKEARDYGKKAHNLYGLPAPTVSDYTPTFYGNPPHGGLNIDEDDYTPIPIIKEVQVLPNPNLSSGPLVVYNWDNSLKHQPSGKGLRFYNRVSYLDKSGNWKGIFSDGRGVGPSDLPSFVTDATLASGESSYFRIRPKNATGEFSVKFYFQLGGAGPTSDREVVFEFNNQGVQTSMSINSRQ